MADDKFKLPLSSYEELAKIIKAYNHFSQEVALEEVSRLTSLHTTIISRNVAFLLAAGILAPGAKKAATPLGKQLARALEHEMPDEIRNGWRIVVQDNEFLSRLLAAIKIRNGMDQQTLESHIAYSAGQPKKAQFMTGARTVIEILRAAELIRDQDGKYLVESVSPDEGERSATWSVGTPVASKSPTISLVRKGTVEIRQEANVAVAIAININISCTPNEIDGLGTKLKALISELKDATTDK